MRHAPTLLLLLAGCASTGVISTGPDTYMIAKTSAACGYGTAESVKADVYQEAG